MFKPRRHNEPAKQSNHDDIPATHGGPMTGGKESGPMSGEDVAAAESLGETTVLTVMVDRVNSEAATALYEFVLEFTSAGQRCFVLDLQNVTYLDSACLGVMLRLLKDLEEQKGRIALANVNPYVASLFRITRLDRAFPICRDTMSAMAAVERAA